MRSFTVTLTEGQGVALLQLIDIACKAGGMNVAPAAVELTNVIRAGAQAALNAESVDNILPVASE